MPEQAPLHPVKANPLPGLTVSATAVPVTNAAEQVLPQLIPAGLLTIVPPLAGEAFTFSV